MSRHDPRLHSQTLLDQLVGAAPDSAAGRALAARPETRRALEQAYQSLLAAPAPVGPSRRERLAVAGFVAVLTGEAATERHILTLLAQEDARLAGVIRDEAAEAATPGPYGRFPPGPLSAEDLDGPVYRTAPALRFGLGARLASALEYAHLVALHPRDAGSGTLEALEAAGWTPAEIAELTRLIGFLATLSRAVAGLRAWAAFGQPQPGDAF